MKLPTPLLSVILLGLLAGHARSDALALQPTDVRDALGVNIHFTDPRPGEMAMLAGAGWRWVRMDFAWEATEKQKGVYDFSAYDGLMTQLRQNHMRALFILDYGNPLYTGQDSPRDDAGRAAFAKWASAAVAHFKGQSVLWEMFNEPNGGFWKPTANVGEYAQLALAVGKAIQATAPKETYIGPATSGVDLRFIEASCRAGLLQYWSAVSVHPYRQSSPETADTDYDALHALIAKYAPPGKTIPIISGEWGYSVSWGMGETGQGDYLAREFLFNLSQGIPLSIWYDWHDDGTDPKNQEHNFGTVHNAEHAGRTPLYEPKPAYTAAVTLTRLLGTFHFEKALPVGDSKSDYVLAFAARRGPRRYAAWTTAAAPHTLMLPIPPGAYTVTDEQGKTQTNVTADKSGLPLTLTGSPQYILSSHR